MIEEAKKWVEHAGSVAEAVDFEEGVISALGLDEARKHGFDEESPSSSWYAFLTGQWDEADREEDEEIERFDGYHDCPCCEVHLHGTEALCWDCRVAGCEPHDCTTKHYRRVAPCDMDGIYEDCQIPACPECDTRASLCTDLAWHTNCDEECPNAGKSWPEPRAKLDDEVVAARRRFHGEE